MKQQTLAEQNGFEKYRKKTRLEQFLEQMEQVVPWPELEALVRPYYPRGENGRPPMGLSIMLRVYFLQQWFHMQDQACINILIRQLARLLAPRMHHSSMPYWLAHPGALGLFSVAVIDPSVIPLPPRGSTDLLLLWLVAHSGNAFMMSPGAR